MGPKFSKNVFTFLLLGSVLFVYIFLKAFGSSFTHDESISYLQFVPTSILDILTFKSGNTNNHILNSLLMKFSEQLFGNSEIALRLPNLIMFLVYMGYSFLFFRNTDWILAITLFVLLVSNNPLVDFFGLARGYGLSFGFMLMSLYHFIQSFYNHKTGNSILFHVSALLAVLSNFTMVDFYLSLILIYYVLVFIESRFIKNQKFQFRALAKVHIILFLISAGILFLPVSRIISNGSLDFGGKNGFYADTVSYLIFYTFHGLKLDPGFYLIMKIIFTAIVVIPFVILVQKLIISRNEVFFSKYKGLIISNLLLISISIAIILQHIIFKADYPKLRFSLFLYPLFIIHFGFLLSYLSDLANRKVILIFTFGLALISGARFVTKADLHKCSEWEYDMHTRNMLQELSEYHSANNSDTSKITLGVDWLFEPTVNFYRQTWKLEWLKPADRGGISSKNDYYYIFTHELDKLEPHSYKIITEFKVYKTKTLLLKNINLEIHQPFTNNH